MQTVKCSHKYLDLGISTMQNMSTLESLVTHTFVWQLLWKLKAHFIVESSAIRPMSRKHSMPSGC